MFLGSHQDCVTITVNQKAPESNEKKVYPIKTKIALLSYNSRYKYSSVILNRPHKEDCDSLFL